MAVATLAMLGTTAASVAPIELTEAAWTDNVYANATFKASNIAGINYARAAASNGKMDWLNTYPITGTVAEVNTLAVPTHKDTGNTPFSVDTFASILEFDSNARSCARVDSSLCATDPAGPPTVPAFAESAFNTMELKLPDNNWLVQYVGGAANPIRTTASCTLGVDGTPAIAGGVGVRLRTGSSTSNFATITVPTTNSTTTPVVGTVGGGYRYTTTITSILEKRLNFARAEVRLKVVARDLANSPYWTLDVLLVRAECGLSQPLAGGIVTDTAGRPAAVGPPLEDSLAADLGADEATLLEEKPTEPQPSETTTSAPLNPSGEAESPTSGTSTAAATSTPRRTTTVTSRAPTVTTAPTSASAPSATQVTTSTPAAPAIVIPDEPGTLSPSARLEDVDIVTVGDEDHVVVVEGTSLPSDAKQGAAALETWLGGGTARTTWATFTSDDAEKDGWRWAAINQKTGTIVYIR